MSLQVRDNLLHGDGVIDVKRDIRDRGTVIRPQVVVIHYGVTHNLDSLVAAQRATGYRAHLSIDGYVHGVKSVRKIVQKLRLNESGTHAGPSIYRGRSSVNAFSIGIEICNPGPLIRGAGGKLYTTYGKEWDEDDAVELRHSFPGAQHNWTHWARYSDQEIDTCIELIAAIQRAYPTVRDVVGHDEIAPGRKFDPGPAFPMQWLREKVFAA